MDKSTEFADLKNKINDLLDRALTDKGQIDALMAHYRITGIYHYSLLNSMMIAGQGGSIAMAYKRWQELGRFVKKGERARIVIWRPAIPRTPKAPANEDTEEQAEESSAAGVRSFWLCKVFDVSQTDGKPLEYDHNTAVPESFDSSTYFRAAEVLGFPVKETITGSARGYTDGRTITLSSMSNAVDKTKTLFHELGHCLLRHVTPNGIAANGGGRDTIEIEAEVVAFLCCSFFGVSFDLSQEYISAYISGRDKVRKGRCIRAAQKIISAVLGK